MVPLLFNIEMHYASGIPKITCNGGSGIWCTPERLDQASCDDHQQEHWYQNTRDVEEEVESIEGLQNTFKYHCSDNTIFGGKDKVIQSFVSKFAVWTTWPEISCFCAYLKINCTLITLHWHNFDIYSRIPVWTHISCLRLGHDSTTKCLTICCNIGQND